MNFTFNIFAHLKILIMRIFTVLFLFLSMSSFAQDDAINTMNSNATRYNMNGSGMWVTSKPLDRTIQGSPYLFPGWEGSFLISSKEDKQYKLFNLNYNLLTKKLETVMGKDSVFQYDISKIDYVKSFNRKYKVINSELYLELIFGEKASLLKGFSAVVIDGVISPLTQQYTTPNRYVQKTKYFYLKGETFLEIKLKKKDVLSAFEDKADQIKKYAKDSNLSFGDENDVISLFRYYNTL